MRLALLTIVLLVIVGGRCGPHAVGALPPGVPSDPPERSCACISSGADDEVEVPDEPEDAEPDDHGDALHDPGRPSAAAADLSLPAADRPAPLSPPAGTLPPANASGNPRFLCLCRFLI